MTRPAPRPPRSPLAAALAATAVAALASLPVAPAAAGGWEVRVQEDPFEGTVVTGASSAGDTLGSRLALECVEAEGAARLRLRLIDAAAVDGDGGAVPATEVLLRVDDGRTLAFRPPEVRPATGVGGGLLVDPGPDDAAGSLLAALGAGERAWVKVRTAGRDYLHAYDLGGADEALRAPAAACDGSLRASADASVGASRAAPDAAIGAVPPAVPARTAAVATVGSAPSLDALAASIPPEAMAAAEASLPSGVTMDGLIGHLGEVIGSIEGALAAAAADTPGAGPDAGLDALRDADERLDNFRALFRRLPSAAQAPLSGLVAASGERLRSLSDAALARPGSNAVLGPAVAPIFDTLAALED